MAYITFLGTGGGRFVLLTQKRASGGLWLGLDKANAVIDPGPGSLIQSLKYGLDPGTLDAVICTHNHLDHYSEVEVMAEAMTHGLHRDHGFIALQKDVSGYISDYHKQRVKTRLLEAGDSFDLGDYVFRTIPTSNHSNGVGLRVERGDDVLVYSSDTAYDKKVVENYEGAKVLVLNTIFDLKHHSNTHLSLSDAILVAEEVKPEILVVTHFGVRLLAKDVQKQADVVGEQSGVKTIAATDGMKLRLFDGD